MPVRPESFRRSPAVTTVLSESFVLHQSSNLKEFLLVTILVVNHCDFDEWWTLRYINLHVFARRHNEANSTTDRGIAPQGCGTGFHSGKAPLRNDMPIPIIVTQY